MVPNEVNLPVLAVTLFRRPALEFALVSWVCAHRGLWRLGFRFCLACNASSRSSVKPLVVIPMQTTENSPPAVPTAVSLDLHAPNASEVPCLVKRN